MGVDKKDEAQKQWGKHPFHHSIDKGLSQGGMPFNAGVSMLTPHTLFIRKPRFVGGVILLTVFVAKPITFAFAHASLQESKFFVLAVAARISARGDDEYHA